MEVTEENGQVRAHIYTQNEQVKEALENQMFQLKEQMNQSQTKVQSVEISVGTHEFERNLEAGQQNQEQGQEGQNQRPKKMRNLPGSLCRSFPRSQFGGQLFTSHKKAVIRHDGRGD